MKLKATTLFLGFCLAILAVAAGPAYAASTTGFSSFHVEQTSANEFKTGQFDNAYDCLVESYGAVVNKCGYSVSLEFDLPITTSANHVITVQDYWYGWPNNTTFSCTSYAYAGTGPDAAGVGNTIYFDLPGQQWNTNVANGNGMSIQLICWNVPPGGGIANINWNM